MQSIQYLTALSLMAVIALVHDRELSPMFSSARKLVLVGTIACGAASPFSVLAAVEESPTTRVECWDAGMKWKNKTEECVPANLGQSLPPIEKVVGVISLGCAFVALCLLWASKDAG